MKIRGAESLPEVRNAGPAEVRRNLKDDPASAAMGTAAKYDSKAGLYVAQGVQDLATGIEKMAQDRDRAKATEALNEYMDRSGSMLYDPKSGLMLAQGAGAEGLTSKAYAEHKNLQQEIGGRLNGRQRKIFQEGIAPYDRNVGANIMRREGEQMAKYRSDEADKLLANTAAACANNPDNFSLEAQEETVYQATLGKYGDQGAEVNLKNSKLVRQALLSQTILNVAKKDPIKAQAMLKQFSNSGFSDAEVPDLTERYNTTLSPKEEADFQKWIAAESKKQGHDVAQALVDYDLRGLFKENGGFGENGHAMDKYKKPNHPTFSSDSVYSTSDTPGGEWKNNGEKWSFTPSETNIKMQSAAGLRDYFSRREPGVELVLDNKIKGANAVFEPAVYEALYAEVDKVALPAKAQKLYESTKGDYGKSIAWIEQNVNPGDKKAFRREFQSYYSDMETAKQVTYKKTRDELAKTYLKTGGLGGFNLGALVQSGQLDADGAVTWKNRLDADRERRIAQAERSENKVLRDARRSDQLFELSLRGEYPVVQELKIAERKYGVPSGKFTKNYENAVKEINNGTFTADDLANMVAYGMVVDTHARLLGIKLSEHKSAEGKLIGAAQTRGRNYLSMLLKKAKIDEMTINDTLSAYDSDTIGVKVDGNDFNAVALMHAKTLLESDEIKKKSFFGISNNWVGFDTPAGDVLEDRVLPNVNKKPSVKNSNAGKTAGKKDIDEESGVDKARRMMGTN